MYVVDVAPHVYVRFPCLAVIAGRDGAVRVLNTPDGSRRGQLLAALMFGVVIGTTSAAAQRVMLEVHPRPGDTLLVTLEHSVTISGGQRNAPDSATTVATWYHVVTRDVVERADSRSTIIRALVDSVRMRTTGSIGASPFPGVDRGMEGMKVRLEVMRDGSSRLIDGLDQVDPELRAMFAAMPAVLPGAPVSVGDKWTRELPLPADGPAATPNSAGSIRATFSFDSLTEKGDVAWISLRGRVTPAQKSPRDGDSGAGQMSGTLSGFLRLDRRRGWLAESRANVTIESTVPMPGAGGPLYVKVRVSQYMTTAPERR